MTKGAEEIFDQLWTLPAAGVSYTYNACITVAAKDPFRGLESLISVYDYLIHSLADPRVSDWPLMSNPFPTAIITCLYLMFVHWGPQFMETRKPFELRPCILLYNAAVAGLNLYIGLELYRFVLFLKKNTFTILLHHTKSNICQNINFSTSQQLDFSWTCEPVDYSENKLALRVASALW